MSDLRRAPFIALGLGLIITLLAFASVYRSAADANQAYFDDLVSQTELQVKNRYTLYEQSLLAGLSVFRASEHVTLADWITYTDTINVEEVLTGISGVGYIDYVREEDLDNYLERTRRNVVQDLKNHPSLADKGEYPWAEFTNHPKTRFKDKFIIKYILPISRNKEAVGLDIGFEANRRAAAEKARDQGVPTLTKIIQLVQDHERTPGFLMLLPYYGHGEMPTTVEERRKSIEGWVYAPFIGKNLLSGFSAELREQLAFAIYDGEVDPTNLIYKSQTQFAKNSEYKHQTTMQASDKTWTIVWGATDQINLPESPLFSYGFLALGLLISIGLFLFLKKSMNYEDKIIELAALPDNSIQPIVTVSGVPAQIRYSNKAKQKVFPDLRKLGMNHPAMVGIEQKMIELHEGYLVDIEEQIELDDGRAFIRTVTSQTGKEKSLLIYFNEVTQLNREKDKALEASRAKDDFLANMSHELRTPLNSIIGHVELMISFEKIPFKIAKKLSAVHKSANVLLGQVNNILDISKIEANALKLEIRPFDVTETMRLVESTIQPMASKKGITFKAFYEDVAGLVALGDEHRLMSVLLNLLSNAIKFTPKGGVSLVVRKDLVANHVQLTFIVEDDGVGIPLEKRSRVFEKFAQADDSTTRIYGGTGLGLPIAKHLTQLMNGTINYSPRTKGGSRFEVIVELEEASAEDLASYYTQTTRILDKHQDKKTKGDKNTFANMRIMIADDNTFNQEVAAEYLRSFGAQHISIANDGLEALALYDQNQNYDLIFMDCHMPKMNGYDATKNIRDFEESINHKPAIIVALTADATNIDEKCAEAGMNAVLRKPHTLQELKKVLSLYCNVELEAPSAVDVTDNNEIANLDMLTSYCGNDMDRLDSLIDAFKEKFEQDLEALEKALKKKDSDAFAATCHSLKGSAAFIGAEKLVAICKPIKEESKVSEAKMRKTLAAIQEVGDEIYAYLDKVR